MKLRSLQTKDMAEVIAIQESITRQPVSDRWRQMLALHVDNSKHVGLVVEHEGKVIGFIIGEIIVGGFGSELTGWMEMVGVAPEHMGAGVGRSLAQGLFDNFASQGVTEVLTAVRWDSGDMLAFFKNMGFDRSPFINLQLRVGK